MVDTLNEKNLQFGNTAARLGHIIKNKQNQTYGNFQIWQATDKISAG